ncbi:ABC transporter permease [Hyphomicrobium sp. CS1BSMeth3]|uniref:ABC transporter permease n=1 Tax=Hyphomicrobium sp. CS1BSMeth3 TaxID=1892844 RepID=UPI0009307447|nr:ABC transporter permease [Hyphomicrobium sp. CS1BSMeth3]
MLRTVATIYAIVMMVFFLGPILIALPLSFNGAGFLSYPINPFSLVWYEKILAPVPWLRAFANSLFVGLSATLIATVLGVGAALALSRKDLPAKRLFLAIIIAPMIVPSIILGLGLYFVFSQLQLNSTYLGVIIAHSVVCLPFVVIAVSAQLQTFDVGLVRASQSLGADNWKTLRSVVLPIIAPGVISGAILAFVHSFDEVVMVLFIAGPQQRTLPRQMFDGIKDNIDPSIFAVSTVLFVFTTTLMILVNRLSARKP